MTSPAAHYESDALFLVRRNRWILALALSPVFVAISAIVDGAVATAPFWLLLAGALALGTYRYNPRPVIERVSVQADAGGIGISRRSIIPRARIRAALIAPGESPSIFLMRRLAPRIELRTGSIAEARAIQAALGLDASREAVDFYGLSWLLTRNVFTIATLILIAASMFVGLTTGPPLTFIGQGLVGIGVLMFLVPTRIRVGARGISLRWLWFGRFIGYDAIDDVAVYQHTHVWNWFESGLWIRTSAGSLRLPIRLHYSRVVREDRAGATEVALVWERIREAALVLRGSASPNAAHAQVVGAGDDHDGERAPLQ